jgi:hypothetical protein
VELGSESRISHAPGEGRQVSVHVPDSAKWCGMGWDGMGWGRVRCRVRIQSRCQQDGVDMLLSILQNIIIIIIIL